MLGIDGNNAMTGSPRIACQSSKIPSNISVNFLHEHKEIFDEMNDHPSLQQTKLLSKEQTLKKRLSANSEMIQWDVPTLKELVDT